MGITYHIIGDCFYPDYPKMKCPMLPTRHNPPGPAVKTDADITGSYGCAPAVLGEPSQCVQVMVRIRRSATPRHVRGTIGHIF